VVVTSEHGGTHIDALSHQAEDLKLYGGLSVEGIQSSTGFREHGVENIAPMAGRGVMVDLAPSSRLDPGLCVSLAQVQQACAEQGVQPRRGDVFLARTGNGALWSDSAAYLAGSGMAGEVSQWLAELGVRAVGADNLAWDSTSAGPDPLTGTTLPGHVILLVRSGINIIENLNLEELAGDGVREFAFVCLPLKLMGATGSPVRPIALV
jgi:kynurenine formamidase